MNSFSERMKLRIMLFMLTVLLLLIMYCSVDIYTVKPVYSETKPTETALADGAMMSGSDAVSKTDTETPAEKHLTKEELNAFWDEAVFIGDSVTLGLRNYAVGQRNKGAECLSGAQFLAMGSMSYTNTLPAVGNQGSIHPKYQGKYVTIEEGVRLTGAKNVFIMLGMNDFYAYSLETGLKSAQEVVARIKKKCPDTNIYIESVTPTLYDHEIFNNDNIDIFNEDMKKLCAENGWTYVDIASVMKDADGKFKKEYCSAPDDLGVHMDAEGCAAWIEYLNEFITYGEKTK